MLLDLVQLLPDVLVRAAEQAPEEEDVKAGWVAFGIFIALAVAVALLGLSLTKRLRNAEASEQAGRYDASGPRRRPGARPTSAPPAEPGDGAAGSAADGEQPRP